MKMISKVGSILTGACLLMTGVTAYAVAGVVCPQPTAVTATCEQLKCKYHTTSGTPNDFSQILGLPSYCTTDFDCTMVTSKLPIASVDNTNVNSAYCGYAIQGQSQVQEILFSYHYGLYSYTPVDAPECKGATASNKAGYCVTYGNTAKSKAH